jgi:hypothetical protein
VCKTLFAFLKALRQCIYSHRNIFFCQRNQPFRQLKENQRLHFIHQFITNSFIRYYTMSASSLSSLSTSTIAGIAVGGVFILVTIIGIAISCYALCCKKKPSPRVGVQPPQYPQPYGPYGQRTNTGFYPQQQYGPAQQSYRPPQQQYEPPQQQYGSPQQSYGPPQQQYEPRQQSYGPPQQQYEPPQQSYGQPQQQS